MQSLEGRQLGNYDVIRRIRTGGMGAVYEGRQRTAFERRVAIKVILGTYATDSDMRRRFAREARTVARLHHPHILSLIEFGDEQGVLYLVMPFIEGGTLTGYLRRHLPDVNEVSALFLQLLDAVEYAHEEGLIHRDIKSSNVLLESRRSGTPYAYLADFGLVRTIQQAEIESSYAGTPIPLDQVPGTPHYMAPEQTRGIVTTLTDIYALGVLLYQMLTGELPYNDPDDVEVMKMHLYAPVPNPCAADASIPAELGAVVMRAMAKRPEQRFPDVTAFRETFLAAIDGPVEHVEDLPFGADEEAFEVHELPQRPALPLQSPLRPSQQLRPPAPEPIEFIEPLPPKSGVRRPRVIDNASETPQSLAKRPRITGDPDETLQLGARRQRVTDERSEPVQPQISARHLRTTDETDDSIVPRGGARRPHVLGDVKLAAQPSPAAALRPRAPTGLIAPPAPPLPSRPSSNGRRLNLALLVVIGVPAILILLLVLPRAFGFSLFPSGFPLFGTPPVATVTLTVKSQNLHDTFFLTASPQVKQPDVNTRVIPDRIVQSSANDKRTIATTGLQSSQSVVATGTLLFVNNGNGPVSITRGLIFTAGNGVQVVLNQQFIVFAHKSYSAPAEAVEPGQAGNIEAEAINMPCCGGSVIVSNPQAFGGGSDGGAIHQVTQSDLDSVQSQLVPGLKQKIQQQIAAQLQPDEVQANQPDYTIVVTSDQPVGSQATQVTVTVTVTAQALAYNTNLARDLTSQLLTKEAAQSLGVGYQLSGAINIATPSIEQRGTNGQLYLSIAASGVWMYHLTVQVEEQWRQVIKGASVTLAQSYLTGRSGIVAAHVQLPFGSTDLPTDESQILFVVQT